MLLFMQNCRQQRLQEETDMKLEGSKMTEWHEILVSGGISSARSRSCGIIPSPRYEEIFEPMAGPANPGLTEQIREQKNMLQGLWRRHSDFQFENQRKTVHNYGTRLIRRWRKDGVEVVGHLQAAYDTDGKTVFESFIANQAEDKRKKLKIANLEEVDGFFGLLHLFHGLYEQLSAYANSIAVR
ncbi:hypothetical protein pipiens_012148 [Culex pipiens pipiens]|uniref:Uncharacterized protein n=1 Tax=Culex pipiens pipiens TaxID=38569 RepID=A0ABD1D3J7_CULPP